MNLLGSVLPRSVVVRESKGESFAAETKEVAARRGRKMDATGAMATKERECTEKTKSVNASRELGGIYTYFDFVVLQFSGCRCLDERWYLKP